MNDLNKLLFKREQLRTRCRRLIKLENKQFNNSCFPKSFRKQAELNYKIKITKFKIENISERIRIEKNLASFGHLEAIEIAKSMLTYRELLMSTENMTFTSGAWDWIKKRQWTYLRDRIDSLTNERDFLYHKEDVEAIKGWLR